MIKVTLIVKRHEDRFETELSFDSSESKVEYVQALAEFLKKKVYEETFIYNFDRMCSCLVFCMFFFAACNV